jgi:hypothetical protein
LGRELPAEIAHRLRPLEEAGEKQVIIDIWVLRQLLNAPPRMAAERPTKLTREASDELIAEGRTCRTKGKSKGQPLWKEELDPIIEGPSAADRLAGSGRRTSPEPLEKVGCASRG